MRFGLLVTLAFSLVLPVAVGAQSLGDLGDTSSFTLSATPQYPMPYGRAVLSFLSSSLDLTSAILTVSANGKRVYQGTVQPVAVTLGRPGSVTNVAATISSNGANYTETLFIQPQDVTIVAEPVSSAPILYPGKPLVPLEGDVRVVAVANLKNASGKSLNPGSLAYAWTVDGTQIANSSGIGRESILVASPLQYRERTVSVAVRSTDGSLVGGASLSLTPGEPSVRIYESDPLFGIRFDHALSSSYSILDAESTLYAAPFSLPTTNGVPFLQWFLNGNAVQTGNLITLRSAGKGQGTASLSLTASAGNYTATTNLSLSFGAKPGNNLFGL